MADIETHVAPGRPREAPKQAIDESAPASSRMPSIIVALIVVAVASGWNLTLGALV